MVFLLLNNLEAIPYSNITSNSQEQEFENPSTFNFENDLPMMEMDCAAIQEEIEKSINTLEQYLGKQESSSIVSERSVISPSFNVETAECSKRVAETELTQAREKTEKARMIAQKAEEKQNQAKELIRISQASSKMNLMGARFDHFNFLKAQATYTASDYEAKRLFKIFSEAKVKTSDAVLYAIKVENSPQSIFAETDLIETQKAEREAALRALRSLKEDVNTKIDPLIAAEKKYATTQEIVQQEMMKEIKEDLTFVEELKSTAESAHLIATSIKTKFQQEMIGANLDDFVKELETYQAAESAWTQAAVGYERVQGKILHSEFLLDKNYCLGMKSNISKALNYAQRQSAGCQEAINLARERQARAINRGRKGEIITAIRTKVISSLQKTLQTKKQDLASIVISLEENIASPQAKMDKAAIQSPSSQKQIEQQELGWKDFIGSYLRKKLQYLPSENYSDLANTSKNQAITHVVFNQLKDSLPKKEEFENRSKTLLEEVKEVNLDFSAIINPIIDPIVELHPRNSNEDIAELWNEFSVEEQEIRLQQIETQANKALEQAIQDKIFLFEQLKISIEILNSALEYRNKFANTFEKASSPALRYFYYTKLDSVNNNIVKLEDAAQSVFNSAENIIKYEAKRATTTDTNKLTRFNEAITYEKHSISQYLRFAQALKNGDPKLGRYYRQSAMSFKKAATALFMNQKDLAVYWKNAGASSWMAASATIGQNEPLAALYAEAATCFENIIEALGSGQPGLIEHSKVAAITAWKKTGFWHSSEKQWDTEEFSPRLVHREGYECQIDTHYELQRRMGYNNYNTTRTPSRSKSQGCTMM